MTTAKSTSKTNGTHVSTACDVRVGCAGWSLSAKTRSEFSSVGTHLERYAERFSATEINSSFYRPHKPDTYARWANSVPDDFQFSVKIPKVITHERGLMDATDVLERFLFEAQHLGRKLGCLLVQLPPRLEFEAHTAGLFFEALRERYVGLVAVEPRHQSWFSDEARALLETHRLARVAADPAPVPEAAVPGGHDGLAYYRLHGSPRTYFSAYTPGYLQQLSRSLQDSVKARASWCIFDNTASGAAISNALELTRLLQTTARRF
jgi:uncharacterized protein YecE (DUF72 family)